MRQVIYISTATTSASASDAEPILKVSRHNNARDGVTGLLYFDGKRFLQALEGEMATLDRVLTRIEGDPRHRAIVILSDREVENREFGAWTMAHRAPGMDGDRFLERIGALVANASPMVRATFTSFAEVRRAA
ncbi:MAG: BLUF domain-containing protein [Pseudomonadota bacterium]